MKRSEINEQIRFAKDMFQAHHFLLPKWAYWSPADWMKAGPQALEVKESMLGWDITDFGSNDYSKLGLLLFTIRNGNLAKPSNQKTYAEKIMLVQVNQVTPLHFHWSKMEDIINRGGGNLIIQLYNSRDDESLDEANDVKVSIDGIVHTVKAGGLMTITPGESICLTRGLYHKFWADKASCMVGEVSMTNDDNTDNRFHEKVGRFPAIEEDEAPLHLLCNEYPALA